MSGGEAGGSGTVALTFNLTKDPSGNITAATLDVTVSATGFPPGTSLTASHIHGGAAGVNGGSFAKRGVTLPVDRANSIMSNPSAFYVNIRTADNPGGVARGQLTAAQ